MPRLLLAVQLAVLSTASALAHRLSDLRRRPPTGQATAEYALVLLGAAAIALMLVAWAAKSGKIGELFDAVVGQLIDKAG